jgi:hypothetical protein
MIGTNELEGFSIVVILKIILIPTLLNNYRATYPVNTKKSALETETLTYRILNDSTQQLFWMFK